MPSIPDSREPLNFYDFDEAVAFTSTWTGLPGEFVAQVLKAGERYLELAGLLDAEREGTEFEALVRERLVYANLLPADPGVLDARRNAYVALVTGLDEGLVERVDQGEMAYMETLDIVTWEDEAEREGRLGGPTISARGIEAPLSREPGDFWLPILEDPEGYLPMHLADPLGPADLRLSLPSPDPGWEAISVMAIPQGPGLETWRMDAYGADGACLLGAYPVARDGARHTLTLHRARTIGGHLEAMVEASTVFDAELSYFDTGWMHPRSEWAPDTEAEVQLAAFAFHLEPAPDQSFRIANEAAVRRLRGGMSGLAPEDVTDLSPIEVHSGGMACLLPMPEGNPYEYQFQGPIAAVDLVQAWGQPVYRLDVTVMVDTTSSPEDQPFTLPIYVAEHRLAEGYRPRSGDQVRGALWLQGCLTGLPYPFILED